LPLEELLSGVASGAGVRSASPASSPRTSAAPPRPAVSSAAPPAAPPLSPFGPGSGSWNAGPSLKQSAQASPVAEMERSAPFGSPAPVTEASAIRAPIPFPAASSPVTGYASGETLTEGSQALSPQVAVGAPSMESLRHAVGCALVEGGHESAAQLLGAGTWTLEATSLRIDVAGMGKKMLAITVNAAAEKIIRQELQRLGAPTRFMIAPGAGSGQTGAAQAGPSSLPPAAGSVREAALANPLVQRAKEIFKAEILSVIDLRAR